MRQPSSFAVLPAAGRSRRMRRPKLLMPWQAATVIEAVLAAWRASAVDHVVVVVRPDDEALARRCRQAGADVVVPPWAPAQMKDSVAYGLRHIQSTYRPADADAWLLAPADMPKLPSAAISTLLRQSNHFPGSILVPTFDGHRGHPVLFPWRLSQQVLQLPEDQGVNALLKTHHVVEVAVSQPGVLQDIDTPAEFARLKSEK